MDVLATDAQLAKATARTCHMCSKPIADGAPAKRVGADPTPWWFCKEPDCVTDQFYQYDGDAVAEYE